MLYKGFYEALDQGLLDTTPDVRCKLVMSGFAGALVADAVNLVDLGALDEFDGLGYAELDCADVLTGYADGDNTWYLDFANGNFGLTVLPGTDVMQGLLCYLYVDGTAANDIVLGYTTDGGFGVNSNGGPINFTVPPGGLISIGS